MQNVILPRVIMLNVFQLSVIMPSVVAPVDEHSKEKNLKAQKCHILHNCQLNEKNLSKGFENNLNKNVMERSQSVYKKLILS